MLRLAAFGWLTSRVGAGCSQALMELIFSLKHGHVRNPWLLSSCTWLSSWMWLRLLAVAADLVADATVDGRVWRLPALVVTVAVAVSVVTMRLWLQ